ncbi:choice-of-anchor M domain-containing protein [Actinomyces urogenitalis]|uniref:choice-of-anchor M domain-containing protein n=1 Tax=Actinomyces urogenitalis TaxID=103621 RepID=UPI00242C4D5E|nr:choice-of-anchor M domain-containing protein [Actinomyces urogenitalis]MCI7457119.1 choice-of-anchor M domain-containing protein [Actinomyces urogenitalis]
MTPRPHLLRTLAALATTLAATLAATFALAAGSVAWADPPQPDPDLSQAVGSDEQIAHGPAVIDAGHVDLGPRYVDGTWTVMARDDSGAEPVWRDPQEVVIKVSDAAVLDAPTGEEYSFMDASQGERWYVIPQTQAPGVVWLGWSSQDPGVVEAVDRGVTMSVGPVSGPGRSWLFVQSGTFGEPLLLMDGQKTEAQDVWVDLNTHVHANWVFTDPGVYTSALTFSAQTRAGEQLSATTTLRFAVGDSTSTQEALAAPAPQAQSGPQPGASAPGEGTTADAPGAGTGASTGDALAGGASADGGSARSTASHWLWLPLFLLALGGGTVVIWLVRRRRAVAAERAQAQAEMSAAAGGSAAALSAAAGRLTAPGTTTSGETAPEEVRPGAAAPGATTSGETAADVSSDGQEEDQ